VAPNRDAVDAKIAFKTGTRTQMRTAQFVVIDRANSRAAHWRLEG
jgi:hypothetical protein